MPSPYIGPPNIVIIGSTGAEELAEKIYHQFCRLLNEDPKLSEKSQYLHLCSRELRIFTGGEILAKPARNVRGATVIIVAGMYQTPNASFYQNFAEVKQLAFACKGASASYIFCVAPYVNGSKQERKSSAREPLSLQQTLVEMAVAGFNKILTIDPHTLAIESITPTPFIPCQMQLLTARYIFARDIKNNILLDKKRLVLFSPDEGGVKRTRRIRGPMRHLSGILELPMGVLFKDHPNLNEAVEVIDIAGLNSMESVRGKGMHIVLVDDFSISRNTLAETAKVLKETLEPERIICYITTLVPTTDPVRDIDDSVIDELVTLDHMPIYGGKSKKIRVIPDSASVLYAKALKIDTFGGSVSGDLFNGESP